MSDSIGAKKGWQQMPQENKEETLERNRHAPRDTFKWRALQWGEPCNGENLAMGRTLQLLQSPVRSERVVRLALEYSKFDNGQFLTLNE